VRAASVAAGVCVCGFVGAVTACCGRVGLPAFVCVSARVLHDLGKMYPSVPS
jgi:hypothetical protein